MSIGERIKQRREHQRLTRNDLVNEVPISYATLAGIENGDQQTTPKLWRIAEVLKCRPRWLETGDGPIEIGDEDAPRAEDLSLSVPSELAGGGVDLVYVDKVAGASLSAGSGEVLWDFETIDKSHAFRLDWMQKKGLRTERCKVWTVRGDSMDPKYPNGSWVLINMAERAPVHGKNFALIGEDGLRLKQLRRSETGGWVMYSLNPDQNTYSPEPIVADNYAIIGRVRSHGGDDD